MSINQPAQPKPTVTRNSSEFNRDAYASIPSGELIVFAVQVLQADGSPAPTEDIVSICFRFFPHSFALKNYFYWPDSALVTRRLHDAKEKGLLKGNAADGFEVKVQGRQAAKHVAKALGVVFPVPPKVEVVSAPIVIEKPKAEEAVVEKKEEKRRPERAEGKKEEPVVTAKKAKAARPGSKKSVKKKQAKKPATPRKKTPKTAAPVKKKAALKPKVQPKPAPKKNVRPAVKAKVIKKPVAKAVKKEETRKKLVNKPAPKLKTEKKDEPFVSAQGRRKKKAQGAKATQLAMPLTPPTAWKKVEATATKPKVREEARQVKREEKAPAAVSKEEKDKAGKVIKQIERSDAYRSYRRNGRRATIGEFDFRNMLFATMESSAETLKRNTDLFKRYAGIHFRADLIAFLEFCEERFSSLLISKVKGKR